MFYACTVVFRRAESMHEIMGSNPQLCIIFQNILYPYIREYSRIQCSVLVYPCIYWFVVICTCLCLNKCVMLQFTVIDKVYTSIYQYGDTYT
jgi:hypothetical protein